MIKQLKMLFLIVGVTFLVGCAATRTKTVAFLPAGSKIALVTGFDHDITYRYVGRTVYLNNEFEFKTYKLTPELSLVQPIKAALEKNGYQVITIPITNKKLREKINFEKGELTASQRDYLMSLPHQKVDRVIIMTKTISEDYNNVENVGFGYGYIQTETDLYKGTNAFSAVKLHVISMQKPSVTFSEKIWATEQVDNALFAEEPSKVTTRSILQFNKWMARRFSGYVLDAMRSANMLR